ncbi:MAG: hypothetical protein IPN22_05175 [Bacteroidetes bacterium]|nr:hypothetical protein [Bacteroidota bacterium]
MVEDFIVDLKQAIADVRAKRMAQMGNKLQSAVVKGLSSILPEGSIARLQKDSKPDLNNENKAAMYGMMGALSGT